MSLITAQSRSRLTRPALVCVAHGSRDPAAERAARALLARVRRLRPGLRTALGHVELTAPSLPEALAALPAGTPAVVVPLLFTRGHHVKHDLPHAVARAAPHTRATLAAPLGPHPLLAEALADRLARALPGGLAGGHPAAALRAAGCTAVVLAAAGSRDPDATAGTRRIARDLSARLDGLLVVPAYASAARPTVDEAVRGLRARGHRSIATASCFAAPGRFATQAAHAAPGPVAPPLGPHPSLARLVLHRYDEAVRGAGTERRTVPVAPGA
ncbi:CbiX/SirB N-terminal domain-containing protein [Streptomyces sp. HNM0574]|uniref:sirohydrochlorin chelatase n=1 Tax=Streptomyces sp. HNM0574 TaxID=2714954 RepID=UPI00146EBFDE|nr:CbiX/SirB N-terminal domain-containing protein [Streptomyces sp. HNM0574]NLU69210.1 sirohydrochlorin chelatase [Streptomyces sp. HNM0574]